MIETRTISRASSTSGAEIRELLQALLLVEIVLPSREFWFVSARLSDVQILDNRSGAFSDAGTHWGPRCVRLSEMLLEILERSRVFLVTSSETHNNPFVQRVSDLAAGAGRSENLILHRRDHLPLEGLLGRDYYLSGALRFDVDGVGVLDDGITLESGEDAIGNARTAFQENYGGQS